MGETYTEGTLRVRGRVYWGLIEEIEGAIEALIREPYGCFEQYSSVTYPMVMGLQILKKMQGEKVD